MVERITIIAGLAYSAEYSKALIESNYLIDDSFLLSICKYGDGDVNDILDLLTYVQEVYNVASYNVDINMRIFEEVAVGKLIHGTARIKITIRRKE